VADYTLIDAAARLGLTPEAVRARVKRGRLEGYRDNHGRWRVRLPDADGRGVDRLDTPPELSGQASAHTPPPSTQHQMDSTARDRLAIVFLHGKVDGLEARLADRDRECAELKAERDRLLAMLEQTQAALIRTNSGRLARLWDRLVRKRGAGT
jgi:hypothetical protein